MKNYNIYLTNFIFYINTLFYTINSLHISKISSSYMNHNIIGDCSWVLDKSFINNYKYNTNSNIICHDDIMIFYNYEYKLPISSYSIHTSQQTHNLIGGRKLFMYDPSIPNDKQHSPEDIIFKKPYSRGHLTPSYIMSYNKSIYGPWYQTYYITNILPQSINLNEGQWEKFEQNIINRLNSTENIIWEIYTGGTWHPTKDTEEYIFWKAICDRKKCSSALISAYSKKNKDINWKIDNIEKNLKEHFTYCCPNNLDLEQWKDLIPN